MSEEQGPLPYETAKPLAYEWTDRAADMQDEGVLVAVAVTTDGVVGTTVRGPCPRCAHRIEDQQVDTVVMGGAVAVLGADASEVPDVGAAPDALALALVRVVVTCSCGQEHPGRPDDVTAGCGISFAVLADETPP
ncbi:MAG TPA: hypothetical protein VK507_24575 [Iamia sp.]|nr:hypothetical protein [Iamia sp.]